MAAMYKREVSSYFNSMIGWIFIAVLTVFIGIYFFAYNLFQGYPYFSYSLGSSLFVFMVVIPILTMRSMAEDRHSKTDQLLLTAPVSLRAVVLGKYLAMLTVFAVPVLIACLCPLIILSLIHICACWQLPCCPVSWRGAAAGANLRGTCGTPPWPVFWA